MVNLQFKEGRRRLPCQANPIHSGSTYSTRKGNAGQLVQLIPPIQGQPTVQGRDMQVSLSAYSTRKGHAGQLIPTIDGQPTVRGRVTLVSSSQPLMVNLQYNKGSRQLIHLIQSIQGQPTVQERVNLQYKKGSTYSTRKPLIQKLFEEKKYRNVSQHCNYESLWPIFCREWVFYSLPGLAGLITQNTVISVQKNLPAWLV